MTWGRDVLSKKNFDERLTLKESTRCNKVTFGPSIAESTDFPDYISQSFPTMHRSC